MAEVQSLMYIPTTKKKKTQTACRQLLLILPALNEGEESFLQGDNPITTVFENYGSSITNNFLDSFDWIRILRLLPEPVMQGLTYPEENEFIPLPGFAPASTILTSVVGHEMMHNAHTLSGVTKFVPTEGLANGVEMDPRLNDNVFSTFRAPTWEVIT